MKFTEEPRLMPATFIVATYIASVQMDAHDRSHPYAQIVYTLLMLLVLPAAASFLFIMVQALAMDTLIITSRSRHLLHNVSRVLYAAAVFMYATMLVGLLLALAMLKASGYHMGQPVPLWPFQLIEIAVYIIAILLMVRGVGLIEVQALRTAHRKLASISLLSFGSSLQKNTPR